MGALRILQLWMRPYDEKARHDNISSVAELFLGGDVVPVE